MNGIKTKQDKIKNSNIVEKIWFVSEMPLPEKGSCLKKMCIYKSYLSLKILICKKAKQCYDKSNWPSNRFLARNLTLTKDFTQVTCLTAATAAVTLEFLFVKMLCYVLGRLHFSCVLCIKIGLFRWELINKTLLNDDFSNFFLNFLFIYRKVASTKMRY